MSLLGFVPAACSGLEPTFRGTVLTSNSPAPPFELENQFGQRVSLSDYKGEVLLLTFLYTSCPDICPLTTSHLRDAHEMLGDDADGVDFVAISVDPERDTVEEAYSYSQKWGMTDTWDFLVGERQQLSPIWKAYYLDPAIGDRTS